MIANLKKEKLAEIFEDIYNINVCGKDELKVRRDISKTNLNANVMIIAEAMAPEQVRLSGINYFYKDGKIGSTGKQLEKFLNLFDHSVYPNHPNCVYHTEIVHSFPGYAERNGRKSIRRPNQIEVEESIRTGILQREIDIIKPKLILLMGNTAYTSFYRYILGSEVANNLTAEVERVSSGNFKTYKEIPVIPIQHSSGANPRFTSMLKNEKLVYLIKTVIK